jgi:SAM-dependent methyltransferase
MHARRINFDMFGDREQASSRLRAWMLADQLQALGHQVTVNGPLEVEIQVFQKRRDAKRLSKAKSNGARIVFDFDDNYLLDDVGAKDDVLAFMNQADVVTVGSRDLLERARRYHENVVLFENPLDVLPGSGQKTDYRWNEKIGWFGAPENQGILHTLGLRERVTTVTADGDIPWSLETVDEVLKQFDLVLLPVEADAWTLAKNANRLLKCVALGVPFLASQTPEHSLVVDELGLPDWLLVEAGGDWPGRIAEVSQRHAELPALFEAARARAFARYGIAPVAARWLREIQECQPAPALSMTAQARDVLADIDVVVLGEDAPALIADTLRSLRGDEVIYRSVSVVSALPVADREAVSAPDGWTMLDQHGDFFEIYDSLARVLSSRGGAMTLLLQAGVHITRGLLSEMETLDPDALHLFRGQIQRNEIALTEHPPATLDQLISRPYRPAAVLLPNRAYDASAGLQARFGPLAVWELLIGLVSRSQAPLHAVATPLMMIAPELPARTPMQSYAELLELTDPAAAADLPSLANEWARLLFSLHAAVIEAHAELFRSYQSTIIPRLSGDLTRAKTQQNDRQRDQNKSSRWIAQLRDRLPSEPPRLLRLQTGTIYLIEAGMKRHVPSWLLVRALEELFGPLENAVDDLEGYEDGPPVEVLSEPDGRLFLIVARQRYRVRGLPIPVAATPEHLNAVPEASQTIDLARGVKQASDTIPPAPPREQGRAPDMLEETVNGRATIAQHANTWVEPKKLGKNRPYRATFGTRPFINDTHRRLLEAPLSSGKASIDIGIPDSLRPEDAAKLYELAYFSRGDALVLGSGHGLAMAIVAQAIRDASRPDTVIGVDPDRRLIDSARSTLDAFEFTQNVTLVQDDLVSYCETLSSRGGAFGLVFVDHVTRYGDVRRICELLPSVVRDGGFVLFHDFNDRRNSSPKKKTAYGIYAGVIEGLASLPFDFYGVFGSSGLYRKQMSTGILAKK